VALTPSGGWRWAGLPAVAVLSSGRIGSALCGSSAQGAFEHRMSLRVGRLCFLVPSSDSLAFGHVWFRDSPAPAKRGESVSRRSQPVTRAVMPHLPPRTVKHLRVCICLLLVASQSQTSFPRESTFWCKVYSRPRVSHIFCKITRKSKKKTCLLGATQQRLTGDSPARVLQLTDNDFATKRHPTSTRSANERKVRRHLPCNSKEMPATGDGS
jgi:hypothetical protein